MVNRFPDQTSEAIYRWQLRNAVAETVNGYCKTELSYGPTYSGPERPSKDVELSTLRSVHWHNTVRLHGYLDDVRPAEFEAKFYVKHRTDQTPDRNPITRVLIKQSSRESVCPTSSFVPPQRPIVTASGG